jgi:hypothetical protein
MAAGESSYQAVDAEVSTNPGPDQVEYLSALVDQHEAAAKKIRTQIKGLERTLADVQADLKTDKAALAAAKKG